tara:strand:- start:5253 stop:6740 length:1488 start_codon:yes stop_codon:yes gene_type:complete
MNRSFSLIDKIETISIHDKINYIAFLVFFITAIYSIGHYKSDEHYQILEFAQYKLGQIDAEDLPWEFDAKMRPTIQPWFVVGIVWFFNKIQIANPFTITIFLRIMTAFLLWLTTVKLNKVVVARFFTEQRWAILFSCCSFFLWYVPFISVRFSSESYAAIFLLSALYLILNNLRSVPHTIFIGIFLGISVIIKAQMGLAVLGIFAWLYFNEKKNLFRLFPLLPSFLLVIIFGVYLDSLFYNEFAFTPYNFIIGNLAGGKASEFGTAPFYYYVLAFLMATIPPISLVLPLFFFSAIRELKNNIIVWALVPYILVHCFIGHKEVRFFLPVQYLIIFLTTYGLASYFKERNIKKYQMRFFKVAIVLNTIVMIYMALKPANGTVLYQKYLYEHINEGSRTILTTNRDYYKITGELQTSFYRPKNIRSFSITNDKEIVDFMFKKDITSCLYVHRGLSFSDSIPGYSLKKVYALYPDWITKVPFINASKIRTDCIYLVTKL